VQASGGSTGTQDDDQGLSRYSGGGAGGTDRQQTDPSVWRPYWSWRLRIATRKFLTASSV
jgi:hypothetical protein